jgi:hypothetical protein
MIKFGLFVLLIFVSAGCNLSRTEVAAIATDTPAVTEAVISRPTRTPIPFGITTIPTLLPLPGNDGGGGSISTPQPTLIPVTSAPPLNTMCQVYVIYSGADPRNSLSLRTSTSVTAPQVFRVPNNAQVLLVPTSQEAQGDGYHWLNIMYVDKETRYIGWMARDSFSKNGVRDPSIATLRPLGATAAC